MTERPDPTAPLPGVTARPEAPRSCGVEIAGAALAILWLVLSTGYTISKDLGTAGPVATALVIVLPVAMIWVGVVSTRTARMMRAETARLGAAVDALRQAYVAQSQMGRQDAPGAVLQKRLDEIAASQAALENKLTIIASAQIAEGALSPAAMAPASAEPADPLPDDQPTLSLEVPATAQAMPVANEDFIRALHFPETAEDEEGFAALRRALQDRQAAHLIQAAQDVLTLLSQDGIYMDDLSPDMARPEVWRAFAHGARGREIADLGGVHDRTALALAAGRMKQDPIFRDAAHHFLRRFDRTFARFEPEASDADITGFATTRTARAFMLLGRVAGTFD